MTSYLQYRILQIVRGGKILWMDKLVPIHWKTFAVCQLHWRCAHVHKQLSMHTCEMPKFHHNKAFKSAMVDKVRNNPAVCTWVSYLSLKNSWITILISSGALEPRLEPCVNSFGKTTGLSLFPGTAWHIPEHYFPERN